MLKFLTSQEFQPLKNKSLRVITQNSLFFVSLATAKRVRELQALSAKVPTLGQGLVLSYMLSFIAKTEAISNLFPRSFPLKALSDFAEDMPEELLLCPVRVLKIYLE